MDGVLPSFDWGFDGLTRLHEATDHAETAPSNGGFWGPRNGVGFPLGPSAELVHRARASACIFGGREPQGAWQKEQV